MSTAQVLRHLYSLDTSSPDLLRYLYSLIQSDDEDQYLSNLEGSELSRLVEFLDKVLDLTPITDDVSRRCLHKLQAICGHHKILPSSYNVSGDLTRVDSDPVASGGFSDVWEGIHGGKTVCIKLLRITQQSRQATEKAFCKEAVMWKRLKHPNIVGFIGITRNPLQFVSEWMPNGTLTEYLNENSGANRIGLLLDVTEGLAFLHAACTTHGDLKGPNVLIDHNGHARLTDFGFTSVVRGVDSVLVTGVQGYSARWAAPEVLGNGDRNTREADIFSFGMIVIEVFTGKHPFSEFSALATISKIITGERPDRPEEPSLTGAVWDMTLHCWDEDPVRRPTMTSVVGILRKCSRLYNPNPILSHLAPLPPEILAFLPESEVKRQTVIRKVIATVEQYVKDLDFIEEVFIRPLRSADPPVIRSSVDGFIDEVFGNILDLRECNNHLLGAMYARQREQGGIISRIGDIFLDAATKFRLAYLTYIGQLAAAERRLEVVVERNGEFSMFLEQSFPHPGNVNKMGLRHWLNHPLEHPNVYLALFEAILKETAVGNSDIDLLKEAVEAVRNLQLKAFQMAMGRGPTGKFEWPNLVPEDVRGGIPKQVVKYQTIIFELIRGEMNYVNDLGNLEYMFVRPLRSMDPPIIPPQRLETFIQDVFHNLSELHMHHKQLLDQLFEIQIKEHPIISSIAALMHSVFLNSRDAYLKYIPNFPIAEYRIDNEMASNPQFKPFVDQCLRQLDAHGLGLKDFIHRPTDRLLRYDLLLKALLRDTPTGHGDLETMPMVLDTIKELRKETELEAVLAKRKVALWGYNANLVLEAGEHIALDLLDGNRSLVHTGKFLREPETGFERGGWTELFVFLFDNYLVMTIPGEENGVTKYHVYQRPIPLDLLTLWSFTDPPVRVDGLRPFDGTRETDNQTQDFDPPSGGESFNAVNDTQMAYPCQVHHNGRLGGICTLFAGSFQARLEWKAKLEEALELRKVLRVSNKVFEVDILNIDHDTVFAPTLLASAEPPRDGEGHSTSKITCSVPFTAPDGRGMIAVGCAAGLWIGLKHDSRSMRRVWDLQFVTQCAVLEEFGVFLVLAHKWLFACHVGALVPSSLEAADASQALRKLSKSNDVQFFTVGSIGGGTVVVYMKKENHNSIFRVLEPDIEKISGKTKAQHLIGSRFGFRSQASEWFRVRHKFALPYDSYGLSFLTGGIAILCSEGFKVMDLSNSKSWTVPRADDSLMKLRKRIESCRPIGVFTAGKRGVLLCYDEFGLYVSENGNPSPVGTVEWEGKADRVASHPPHILLFDPRFIEVRHVRTGRLVQIIPGKDMRCIWDGRGAILSQLIHKSASDDVVSERPRVHGVMTIEATQPDGRGVTTERVFELVLVGL